MKKKTIKKLKVLKVIKHESPQSNSSPHEIRNHLQQFLKQQEEQDDLVFSKCSASPEKLLSSFLTAS